MRSVHFVVPDGIDDPDRPSGGNIYDRKIIQSLADAAWTIHEHLVAGNWPYPDRFAECALSEAFSGIPDGSTVVVDGLLTAANPSVLVAAASRLRFVVLVHLPFGQGPPGHVLPGGRERERAVLMAARAVITTSEWARCLLLHTYGLEPQRVYVAAPGVDVASLAPGTPDGRQLICIAAVTWHKGHDVLLAALSELRKLPWRCTCVGALDREPAFASTLLERASAEGLGDKLIFPGTAVGAALDRAYAAADILLLPSRGETYGMVLTEALARGLPVIAAEVGGVPATIGRTGDGRRPGLLVPAEDPQALATAIRSWLEDGQLRNALRAAAADRRRELSTWSTTAGCIGEALDAVAA